MKKLKKFYENYTKNKNPFKHYINFDKNNIRILNEIGISKK